jgi:hypothetical protein
MVHLKPGDKISCHIKDNIIVASHKEYDEARTFEIVAVGDYGYYLFVPEYLCILNTINIDAHRCKHMDINPRFLGEQMIHITESMVHQVVRLMDGACCCICQEFCSMAAANQENGLFVCWSCRRNPYL